MGAVPFGTAVGFDCFPATCGGGTRFFGSSTMSTSASSFFGLVDLDLASVGCGSASRTAVLTVGAIGAAGGFGVAAGGAIAAACAALAAA